MSRLRVLLLAEQLRRSAAGGIGTYVLGLLQGLDALRGPEVAPELTLAASRPPRGAGSTTRSPRRATRCGSRACPDRC